MGYGVRLHVWGERACFKRPDITKDRVSYDVITPLAARGIIEAIHWRPAIRWIIDRIHVLNPIRFDDVSVDKSMVRHLPPQAVVRDVSDPAVENAATIRMLRDVSYVIEAHFDLTDRAGPGDVPGKHLDIFNRRARKGQYFRAPVLGLPELSAAFQLIDNDAALPMPDEMVDGSHDLGLMLHDIDFDHGHTPYYFHAWMYDGVIEIPPFSQAIV